MFFFVVFGGFLVFSFLWLFGGLLMVFLCFFFFVVFGGFLVVFWSFFWRFLVVFGGLLVFFFFLGGGLLFFGGFYIASKKNSLEGLGTEDYIPRPSNCLISVHLEKSEFAGII